MVVETSTIAMGSCDQAGRTARSYPSAISAKALGTADSWVMTPLVGIADHAKLTKTWSEVISGSHAFAS